MDPPIQPLVGQTVYFYLTAADKDGNAVTFTGGGPTLKLKPPNAATVTGPGATSQGPGSYRSKYTVDVAGQWAYRWEGTDGTDQYVFEQLFTVAGKQVP